MNILQVLGALFALAVRGIALARSDAEFEADWQKLLNAIDGAGLLGEIDTIVTDVENKISPPPSSATNESVPEPYVSPDGKMWDSVDTWKAANPGMRVVYTKVQGEP